MTPDDERLAEEAYRLAWLSPLYSIQLLARGTPGWYHENPKRLRLIGFALIRAGADRDLVNQALNTLGV